MKNTLLNEKIGALVARDYRTSAVFDRYGIDFCCKGGRTLREACATRTLDIAQVERELTEVLEHEGSESIDFSSWPADLLIDYIEKKHHRYVREKIPLLQAWLNKVTKVHGERHPELHKVKQLFDQSAEALINHMHKEEHILFPYIREMVSGSSGDGNKTPAFGSVHNPVQMMMQEHSDEGARFEEIAKHTDQYRPPAGACTTYRVTYATLKEFEGDLHRHIHLENNILFPRAVQLEAQPQ